MNSYSASKFERKLSLHQVSADLLSFPLSFLLWIKTPYVLKTLKDNKNLPKSEHYRLSKITLY